MLLIIPKKYRFETTLSPKRVARKLDGELTEFRPTMNVLATGKFMKSHKLESLYYGRREGDKFRVFYHKFKKKDGGETGFFGTYTKSEHGTLIEGSLRKPVSTYVFGIIWTLLTLLSGLVCLALKQEYGAIACAVVFLAGVFFLFWDTKSSYLYSYLDGFPRYEEDEQSSEETQENLKDKGSNNNA